MLTCRYALQRCVVLCGRGDCLFVRSRHGDNYNVLDGGHILHKLSIDKDTCLVRNPDYATEVASEASEYIYDFLLGFRLKT